MWTVLYIAFGVVALWLLGEVLLQYKARLRWRLLAFGGFLGVVVGVLLSSVVVIGLGAIAFAVGQTYVTLSFRQGFSTGWAIGGRPGASRRRKSGDRDGGEAPAEAPLRVSGMVEETAVFEAIAPGGLPPEAVYEPEPMPDDTNGYGVYTGGAQGADRRDHEAPDLPADAGADAFGAYDPYYGDQQPVGQDDFGGDRQQYAAYSDPYVGGQSQPPSYAGAYEGYDSFGNPQQYDADPYYAPQAFTDTPPGGVWVPQQRDTEQGQSGGQPLPDEQTPDQQQPPYDYDTGYNEQQYRY